MRNRELAADYVARAALRLKAIDVLYEGEGWADVVREAQEAVELALKGVLRHFGVEPPRVHDVSAVLLPLRERLDPDSRADLERAADVSRELRRDRELAFYGAEDLTPSGFYEEGDAARARDGARFCVGFARRVVAGRGT